MCVLAILSAALPSWGQHVTSANPPEASVSPFPEDLFHGSAALGDFDGDHRVDSAVAQPQRLAGRPTFYRVDVHLSDYLSSAFYVDSQVPGGLHVAVLDVDGDHDLDLIITTELGRQPVGLWINDGRGAFSEGNSAAYPAFIWQQTKNFFEAPERSVAPAIVFFCPNDSWTLEKNVAAISLPSFLPAPNAPAGRPPRALINPSSPFRAPPSLF